MMRETMVETKAQTTEIPVQTVPAACLATYADTEAAVWAERMFAAARSASGDAERFASALPTLPPPADLVELEVACMFEE